MTKKDKVIINDLMAECSSKASLMLKNGDREDAMIFIGGSAILGDLIKKLKEENTTVDSE